MQMTLNFMKFPGSVEENFRFIAPAFRLKLPVEAEPRSKERDPVWIHFDRQAS